MYLISIYFDENTENKIRRLIHKVAKKSGNHYMEEAKVPPHITVSAFETDQEKRIIELFDSKIQEIKRGKLQWVSIGVFNPHVIFLAPVLNEYLHNLSVLVNETVSHVDHVSISRFYLPLLGCHIPRLVKSYQLKRCLWRLKRYRIILECLMGQSLKLV